MFRLVRFVCVIALALASLSSPAQQKKRVAVMDFDYGTVQSAVSAIWGSNQDVGKGIADLLVQKLVQDGKYSVIERKALDKILAEQNFGNSNRADSSTAAKIGKMLGVDAIIIGSITQFGRDDKSTGVADVSGNTLILNAGSKSGLKVGDRLEISRAGRTIKDPATGKVLKTITSKIGDATVTEVDADSATVSFAGSGAAKVGDVARTPQWSLPVGAGKSHPCQAGVGHPPKKGNRRSRLCASAHRSLTNFLSLAIG